MNRLQILIGTILLVVVGTFIIGLIVGAAVYLIWSWADFEWVGLTSKSLSFGSYLARLFGVGVFVHGILQYLLFSEPTTEDEDTGTAALGYSVAWFVLFIPYQMPFWFAVWLAFIFALGLAFTGVSVWRRIRSYPTSEPLGLVVNSERNGLAALEWSQLVATQDTLASENARGRFIFYLGFVAVCAVLAFGATGNFEHTFVILILASWFGLFALRGAGSLRMQAQALGAVPHVKTETERREEMIPVTKREDCQAFLEIADNQVWFCIARGDKTKGPLELAERVPWESFSNFEEGSHKQWFRGRGSVSDLADWGVIVAQSSVGRVVRVAESVHEQAWLVELLVTLQNTFIAPRDAMIRQMREAAQSNARAQSKASAPGTSEKHDVPNKQF